MLKSEFHFDLPPDLIAQRPLPERSASRLLVLDADGALHDRQFGDLPQWLRAGDLLVFNDTRVIPARVYGVKDSGGRVELLIERLLDDRRVLAQLRASKPARAGQMLQLDGGVRAQVLGRQDSFYQLQFEDGAPVTEVLARIGHIPLPPYIDRSDDPDDANRYQTVYARAPGAVAAPTAGLHFDTAMLARLDALGVERAYVTLHVGAGTFQPLRVDDIRQHRMHSEWLELGADTAARVNAARAAGRRVIAVGTTVVRALESAAPGGAVRPFRGETAIFIYPGHRFAVIDGLITNFHLPESTLLMLVCALAGREPVLAAYRHAVRERYRFFSYGDAMLVFPKTARPA